MSPDPEDALRGYASRFVDEAQQRELKAKENYERIEAQLRKARLEYDTARDLASGAPERATNFVPMLGGNFQCTRCRVLDNNRSSLSPLPQNLRCDVCGIEYPI
jgi:hypothetical protein